MTTEANATNSRRVYHETSTNYHIGWASNFKRCLNDFPIKMILLRGQGEHAIH